MKELYYKIYRFFKWDFKHLHRDIYIGIINLIRWLPIIFKDRDWDHSFMYQIMKYKLETMAKYLKKYSYHVDSNRDVERINTCIRLIQKIQDDFYEMEYHDYYEQNIKSENIDKTHPNIYELKTTVIKNNLKTYFEKYPNDYRRIDTSNRKLNDSDISKAFVMATNRHERANKILFTILERHLQGWWS